MPIDLNQLQEASQAGTKFAIMGVKTFTPKFFNSKLTGSGGKTGILNVNANPINIVKPHTMTFEHINAKKQTYVNGNTTVTSIPVNILSKDGWSYMEQLNVDGIFNMVNIANITTQNNQKINMNMVMYPHSLIIEEKNDNAKNGGTSILRSLIPCYQLFFFREGNSSSTTYEQLEYISQITNIKTKTKDNVFLQMFTCDPIEDINQVTNILSCEGFNVDLQTIKDYQTNYSLYTAMSKRAEEWQTNIHTFLDMFFENVENLRQKNANTPKTQNKIMNDVVYILRHLENYQIPLDLYREIYNSIQKRFPKNIATILCKQNLNLLLSDQLNDLENNKANLTCLKPKQPTKQVNGNNTNIKKYSKEQTNAITSTEPLILVQAGAGTGKSTVILGRIDYMIANGVNPSDITVLSFTNAAADNIKEKNPNIHSMTIASMIHSIYSLNFPTHELSSNDTIINTLDIYYKNNLLVDKFKEYLILVRKKETNAYTAMNNFIEAYYNDIINILNRIKQTSLELEIIICYQQINNLQEPAEVQSKFLIIDEVQDNSIFEFIYAIKYVAKHKESLFIVGDCSQTLYEFRASNPKALNVLEGSGVFTAYQLQTNYRSNQEILDFANVALQNIEANQYAHIQLQANSLIPVTEKSFSEKVHLHYEQLPKISDFEDRFTSSVMGNVIRPYVTDKLAAGEQVAFLAYKRKDVVMFQKMMEKAFPNASVVSLVPEKTYNSTVFSKFIKNFWNQIKFSPTSNIIGIIQQQIVQQLPKLVPVPDKALIAVQNMLFKWQKENQSIINSWQQQLQLGHINTNTFMENIKENMLSYEIRCNAIRQRLLSSQNEQQKKTNINVKSDIVVSTIHSAKGLEFENAVILYRNENNMSEEDKRMYYVAFTRAMKSELILAYDTTTKPRIVADYDAILKILHNNAPKINTTASKPKPVNIPHNDINNGPENNDKIIITEKDAITTVVDKIPQNTVLSFQEKNPTLKDLCPDVNTINDISDEEHIDILMKSENCSIVEDNNTNIEEHSA